MSQQQSPAWQVSDIFSPVCASDKVYLILREPDKVSLLGGQSSVCARPERSTAHRPSYDDVLMLVYFMCVYVPSAGGI